MNDIKIDNILHEKRYEINMIKYLKTLTKIVPTNEKRDEIRKATLNSVLLGNAIFLTIFCVDCGCRMVDPLCVTNMRYARCGNCGFSLLKPYKLSDITYCI